MKKLLCLSLVFILMLLLCGCGTAADDQSAPSPLSSAAETASSSSDVDIDLTALSSTMVYSEVYNIIYSPEDYFGKTIKMTGTFSVSEGYNRLYYACLISDALACCAQGLEFELAGDCTYPDDFPEVDSEITVSGVFEPYEEDGYMYYHITNAKII